MHVCVPRWRPPTLAARRHTWQALPPRKLLRLYEGLDYYYTGCSQGGLRALTPRLPQCNAAPRTGEAGEAGGPRAAAAGVLTAPFLPAGAYYRAGPQRPEWEVRDPGRRVASAPRPCPPASASALGRSRQPQPPALSPRCGQVRPFLEASFSRHGAGVALLRAPSSELFASSWGAKAGPAPSWTSPLATVRYPLHPNGLLLAPASQPDVPPRKAEVPRRQAAPPTGATAAEDAAAAADAAVFDLRGNRRVAQLLAISDGDLVEIEQWGGWSVADCPPICGMWANVWRGSGVGLRVASPFASLSKGTAVVEMLAALGERSLSHLQSLARELRLDAPARALLRAGSDARGGGGGASVGTPLSAAGAYAASVAAVLLSDHPCAGAGGAAGLLSTLEAWLEQTRRLPPEARVRALTGLQAPAAASGGGGGGADGGTGGGAARFGLHWLFGVCGVGAPLARTGLGWGGRL